MGLLDWNRNNRNSITNIADSIANTMGNKIT